MREGAEVLFGRIEVDQGLKLGVDELHFCLGEGTCTEVIQEAQQWKLILGEERLDFGKRGRGAIEGGEGVETAGDLGDGEVGILNHRREIRDPSGIEKGCVGGGSVGEG